MNFYCRFILTYQILHDYYIAVINKPFSQRLSLKELNKFVRYSDEKASSTKAKVIEEKYRQLRDEFLELQLKSVVIDSSNNPLNVFIDENVKLALKCVQDISESYKTLVTHVTNELAMKFQNASSSSLRKKHDKDSKVIGEFVEAEKLEYTKCMEEWRMGCVGETSRVNLRLTVLQKKCHEDMHIFCNQLFKALKKSQDFINDQYLKEIESVDRLSKYIQMAIEKNQKLSENLLLKGDSFVIETDVSQIPITSTTAKVAEKTVVEMEFKLSHLAFLRDSLKMVAPTGIAIKKGFTYLLQDFVVFGKESSKSPKFPPLWRLINPERIPEFIFSIFGENLYIDWRDFLIYCLNLPFPTVDELLEIRKKFRSQESKSKELIDREIFLNTRLWFENELDNVGKKKLRRTLLKHFLFELFEVSKDVMNYTAFLLAFCKSHDPKEGFSKALALTLGRKVCYLIQECDEAINKLIEIKKLKDEAHRQVCKYVNDFLTLILHKVLDICASTTVIELKDNVIKERRKGKGRISGRQKTSTRSSQMKINKQGSSIDKSDIKEIFMNDLNKNEHDTKCIDEKLNEPKEIKFSEHSDIIYSVSRSIILKVLEICVPWHFQPPDQVECSYKVAVDDILDQLEQDTEDKTIYVCKFLEEPKICKLLHKIKRFSKPNMDEEILSILE